MALDVEEAMALAVLRGDKVAALMLADKLREDVYNDAYRRAATQTTQSRSIPSWEVYQWPEFRALCERLGVPWGLATLDFKLILLMGEFVVVEHEYRASGAP